MRFAVVAGALLLWSAGGWPQSVVAAGVPPYGDGLAQACWLGKFDEAKRLLDAGVEPNDGISHGAQGGHVEIVELLLSRGADVNYQHPQGWGTALHSAALQGGPKMVSLLLKNGADPNLLDHQGETPLHRAVGSHSDFESVKALVQAGAKLDVGDRGGVTPVRKAATHGEKEIYAWLLAKSGGKEPRIAPSDPNSEMGKKSVEELLEAIQLRRADERAAPQRELVARGKAAMPAILAHMESTGTIMPYFELLTAMGPEAAEAIPKIETLLGDKSTVLFALFTLQRMDLDWLDRLSMQSRATAAPALYQAIVSAEKGDVTTGYMARFLSQMGTVAMPYVHKLLESKTLRDQSVGLEALRDASFDSAELTELVISLTGPAHHEYVRRKAIGVLRTKGEPAEQVRLTLLEIIRNAPVYRPGENDMAALQAINTEQRLVTSAVFSLSRFGPDAIDELLPYLTPMDAGSRHSVIEGLRGFGEPAIPRFVELFNDDDDAVAAAAGMALADMGKTAAPAVNQLLADKDEKIALRMVNAMRWRPGNSSDSLPLLYEIAGDETRLDELRLGAAMLVVLRDRKNAYQSPAIRSTLPIMKRALELKERDDVGHIQAAVREMTLEIERNYSE